MFWQRLVIMLDSKTLSELYNKWISETIEFNNIGEKIVRIDLPPFLDMNNDSIVLYAEERNGKILLTDDGYTFSELKNRGVSIFRSPHRKKFFFDNIKSFGVSFNENDHDLFIETELENFPISKHRLLQAVLFVNDMFMLSADNTKHIFLDDVQHFLEENNIRTVPNASFTGKSGMSHQFKFSIAGYKNIPLRLLNVISNPSNPIYAKAMITDVEQTKDFIGENVAYYTFINDQTKGFDATILKLLEDGDIKPILFSKKMNFVDELVM